MQRTQLLVPPAVEPVSLATAKQHLRVVIDDDDLLIGALITAARQRVETLLRQSLISQQWLYMCDNFPWGGGYYNREIRRQGPSMVWLPTNTGILDIPRPPLISVQSIQYYNSNGSLDLIPSTIYNCSLGIPARIQPVFGSVWPVCQPRVDAVQVTYTAGYGSTASSVPLAICQAILLMVGHWYENREEVVIGTISTKVQETVEALLSAFDHGEYA